MSRLLVIDGSNIVMRCAFGGDVPPETAVQTATHMIRRAARDLDASHLVVAMDCPGVESWRKKLYPEYKGNRTTDTTAWITAATIEWTLRKWWVEAVAGWEADDVIATVATRAAGRPGTLVTVLSGDSDVLPLMDCGVRIVKPADGGRFEMRSTATARYGVATPGAIVDLKAMAGEAGDNIPGVEGIGKVRAGNLLKSYENLEGVIAAGQLNSCRYSAMVAASAETARLSKRLATLVRDVPIVPIMPRDCEVVL